jgi:hypothetical protein
LNAFLLPHGFSSVEVGLTKVRREGGNFPDSAKEGRKKSGTGPFKARTFTNLPEHLIF